MSDEYQQGLEQGREDEKSKWLKCLTKYKKVDDFCFLRDEIKCCNCDECFASFINNNKKYCFDCWVKYCFGEEKI